MSDCLEGCYHAFDLSDCLPAPLVVVCKYRGRRPHELSAHSATRIVRPCASACAARAGHDHDADARGERGCQLLPLRAFTIRCTRRTALQPWLSAVRGGCARPHAAIHCPVWVL